MVKKQIKDSINLLFTPLRLILSHKFANRVGLDSIRDDRVNMALRYVRGRLLDIGCGINLLVKRYGDCNSVGIDVHDFGGGAEIVENVANLPFADKSFDTVSFVASFNHIPNRDRAIREIDRVLKDNGIIIITMIGPSIGKLRHMMRWIDQEEGKRYHYLRQNGEEDGLPCDYICSLLLKFKFRLKLRKHFLFYLNCLYIFERSG